MGIAKKKEKVEGIELFAKFIGAWVKYGILMMYVLFSSVAHLVNKFNGANDE